MKPEGAVRQKLKQVRFRHAKRELDVALTRTPSTCEHNAVLDVPGVGEVGVCSLTRGVLCDAGRGADLAPGCATYSCKHTKEGMKEVLEAAFDAPISEVAAKYPDAAALMWVLTDENLSDPAPTFMTDPFGESGVLVGTFFGVQVWAGSVGERGLLATALNDLVESEVRLRCEVALKDEANQTLQTEVALKDEANQTLQTELDSVQEGVRSVQDALTTLETDFKGQVRALEDALRRVTEERDTLQARFDSPVWSPGRWAK
jgi:flagellar capping protein FliD